MKLSKLLTRRRVYPMSYVSRIKAPEDGSGMASCDSETCDAWRPAANVWLLSVGETDAALWAQIWPIFRA